METLSFFDLLQTKTPIETELTLFDVEKFSFNDWKTKSKRLGKENNKEICMFYNLEYNTYNPPYYHCLPQYNTDNSHRYFVLNIDGDCVFVCFKVIQIMNTKK